MRKNYLLSPDGECAFVVLDDGTVKLHALRVRPSSIGIGGVYSFGFDGRSLPLYLLVGLNSNIWEVRLQYVNMMTGLGSAPLMNCGDVNTDYGNIRR